MDGRYSPRVDGRATAASREWLQQRIELLEAAPAGCQPAQQRLRPTAEAASTSARKTGRQRSDRDPVPGRQAVPRPGRRVFPPRDDRIRRACRDGRPVDRLRLRDGVAGLRRSRRSRQAGSQRIFPRACDGDDRLPAAGRGDDQVQGLAGCPAASLRSLVLCAAMLFVAWHQRLRAVAWIAVLAAIPTSAVLLSQTGAVAPYALVPDRPRHRHALARLLARLVGVALAGGARRGPRRGRRDIARAGARTAGFGSGRHRCCS